jgi:hypothetical protein
MKQFAAFVLIIIAAALPARAAAGAPAELAKARAEYPTPSCVVTGEHLEAGKIVEYVHQQEGKPDRLVRLCCNKCVARFKANPAKYLAKLDAAAAAKAGKKD